MTGIYKRWSEYFKGFKKNICWTIADIIVIPPGICTHNIYLEEECTPNIEHQRRLNPPMHAIGGKKGNNKMVRCWGGLPDL